ncbi:echinoderm microtubule-associated protein-like 5 [Platysternon megacephalum]|uniref:Echinoderm microtubule-associated protein-like 5 n=1 Tax=Platysternon megacephalum TaxID=55544 RepID=A0A4D9F9B9_9SAUR|nr:echinoderm microtubule-associated protein-like 5 [Platysternon megacephalum]
MKSLPFLFLLLGVLVLPGLEGDKNPDVKRRDVRSLFSMLEGSQSSPKNIQVPDQADSSLVESKLYCQGPCRDGWFSNMGQCYKFVQEKNTWAGAESVCQRIAGGGHLTSISNAAQNDFLVNLASYEDKRTTQFWTGGSYQKGTSLSWTDGSLPNFIQRPLSSIFNAIGGIFNSIFNVRICLTLNLGVQGMWDGCDCNKKLSFICSYKPNLTPP